MAHLLWLIYIAQSYAFSQTILTIYRLYISLGILYFQLQVITKMYFVEN